jgi:predicted dehydrogenase
MEAVLSLLAADRLDVAQLTTHCLDFDDAPKAYDTLVEDPTALGIVLRYPEQRVAAPERLAPAVGRVEHSRSLGGIAVIGAGNFATRTLLPAIKHAGSAVDVVVSPGGVSAGLAAIKAGTRASADVDAVLADPSIGAVFVATRHDSHASLAVRALEAGKAAYVEKPLALTEDELDQLAALASGQRLPVLTVGFNRRFAPISVRMRELLSEVAAPKAVLVTVNAGAVPADHWTQDPAAGGGRILGEGCHFIDLARFLAGAPITDVSTRYLGRTPSDDSALVSLGFADGSLASIHYLANGSPKVAKERVEVFTQGRVLVNDNFRSLRVVGWRTRGMRSAGQDKGHRAAVAAFLAAARDGGPAPIPVDELVEVSRASIRAGRR